MPMEESELLKYAIENGMIDMLYVQEQIEMSKRKELLEKHPYKIWQGADGYWRTYLPDKEKGRIPKRSLEKDNVEQAVIDYWKEQSENPTIQEVFEEWNDRKLKMKKKAPSTHLRDSQTFKRHFSEFGKKRIKDIKPEEIIEFLEEQIPEHNLKVKAFANLKTVTRGILKSAKRKKLIDFRIESVFEELDVSEKDFDITIKEDYEEVFDEEETEVMLNYLKDNLDMMNIGIFLMFLTGARIGEVVALKHTDFTYNTFNIRRTETRYKNEDGKYVREVKDYPKTAAGIRTAIIPDAYSWLVKEIQKLNPFQDYIFVKDGNRISTQSIRMRQKRICKKLNIYPKSPHKDRKTYGTILMDNHIDNRLITEQMGHTDITCSEKHYHRNRKSIEKKTEILSNIPDFMAK